MKDDEIIVLCSALKRPPLHLPGTLQTKFVPCRYCRVCLDIKPDETGILIRLLIRHQALDTQASGWDRHPCFVLRPFCVATLRRERRSFRWR